MADAGSQMCDPSIMMFEKSINNSNELEMEMVRARNIHNLKRKQDEGRHNENLKISQISNHIHYN